MNVGTEYSYYINVWSLKIVPQLGQRPPKLFSSFRLVLSNFISHLHSSLFFRFVEVMSSDNSLACDCNARARAAGLSKWGIGLAIMARSDRRKPPQTARNRSYARLARLNCRPALAVLCAIGWPIAIAWRSCSAIVACLIADARESILCDWVAYREYSVSSRDNATSKCRTHRRRRHSALAALSLSFDTRSSACLSLISLASVAWTLSIASRSTRLLSSLATCPGVRSNQNKACR